MNNQISRRNLVKLLGVSGITLPLAGVASASDPFPARVVRKEGEPIKLSSNENPYGPSENVRNAIINAFDEACRYPYGRVSELEEKIAKREGVSQTWYLLRVVRTRHSEQQVVTLELRKKK